MFNFLGLRGPADSDEGPPAAHILQIYTWTSSGRRRSGRPLLLEPFQKSWAWTICGFLWSRTVYSHSNYPSNYLTSTRFTAMHTWDMCKVNPSQAERHQGDVKSPWQQSPLPLKTWTFQNKGTLTLPIHREIKRQLYLLISKAYSTLQAPTVSLRPPQR